MDTLFIRSSIDRKYTALYILTCKLFTFAFRKWCITFLEQLYFVIFLIITRNLKRQHIKSLEN